MKEQDIKTSGDELGNTPTPQGDGDSGSTGGAPVTEPGANDDQAASEPAQPSDED